MEQFFAQIRAQIPANKFYPPRLDSGSHLLRERLIRHCRGRAGTDPSLLLIEAQAGQGKSVFASQYLQATAAPFAWYQVGREDGDPVLFATTLLVCLMNVLPEWRSPMLEQMVRHGEMSSENVTSFANILLGDLDSFLEEDFTLAFDDLYLLEGADQSLEFLDHLLATAPPKLRFVCTSRQPVCPGEGTRKLRRRAMVLGNGELALTQEEIGELCREILGITVSGSQARQMLKVTEGWPMGLVLGSHQIATDAADKVSIRPASEFALESLEGVVEYFRSEIFAGLPLPLRRTLTRLSLLETIPVPLAETLSEVDDIGKVLRELMQHNLFVRSLDEQDTLFVLHHLFRNFLRAMASELLGEQEQARSCLLAAEYFARQGRMEEALPFYLKGRDVETARALLAKVGMELFSMNRIVTLGALLKLFPESEVRGDSWHLFFTAVVRTEIDPISSLSFMQQAAVVFASTGQEFGELLALAYQVYYHLSLDGRYRHGGTLLDRAQELFALHGDRLDPQPKILIANYLSAGLVFFRGDRRQADNYSTLCLELAEKHGLDNLKAGVLFTRAFICLLSGDWEGCRRKIEAANELTTSPHVGGTNRLGLMSVRINLLEMSGDFENFARHEQMLRGAVEKDLLASTIIGPFLAVWNGQISLARGDLDQALGAADAGLRQPFAGQSPHMRSQFLQTRALALAGQGRSREADEAIAESAHLRMEAGGPFHIAWNDIMLGAAQARLGRWEEADRHLGRAVVEAKKCGSDFLLASALMQRAHYLLHAAGRRSAISDLKEGLGLMRRHGYRHLYGWQPDVMEQLLSLAVEEGVEEPFARHLARERLGLAFGEEGTVPLLHFTTLGSFSVHLAGSQPLAGAAFSQAQKQLLGLLFCAAGMQLSQEEIMCALWPDAAPQKARSSFDSLLLRLRKTLAAAVKPQPVKSYLVLKKGVLCLENCSLDAHAFASLAETGLQHLRNGETWQAGNAIQSALQRFFGPFMPGVHVGDELRDYRDDLLRLYAAVCRRWAGLLALAGRPAEAVELLGQGLKLDRTNDELVRALYALHRQSGQPALAGAVVKRYREDLRRDDYEPEEAEEIVSAIEQDHPL